MEALKHSYETSNPLNIQELVNQLSYSLIDSKKIYDYYQKEFALNWPLSEDELIELDSVSRIVGKYLSEVQKVKKEYKPSIAELVGRLGITLRQAKLIIPFINKISTEKMKFNFNILQSEYPRLEELTSKMLNVQKKEINLNLMELAADLDIGLYTCKKVISFFEWVSNEYELEDILNISDSQIKALDKKATKALKFFVESSKELKIGNLINDLKYEALEAKEVLCYYEQVISLNFNLNTLPESEMTLIEENARKIHNIVGQKSANLDDLIPHINIGIMDAWKAILYLKQKIMPNLQVTATSIITGQDKIGLTSEKLEITESLSISDEKLDVRSESVKITDHSIDLKKIMEKVEVKREFDYVGGLIRFKVVVANNSGALINEVEVSLGMPEHVRIMHIHPKIYSKKTFAKINSVQNTQSQSIDFYLEPLICGTAPIEARIYYKDGFGGTHSIVREPKNILTKCPPIINRGEENFAKVKNLFDKELNAKQLKSFRNEHDPKRIFELLNEAVHSWAQESVTAPIIRTNPAFRGENYYYVQSKVKDIDLKGYQEQIVVKLETDAELGLSFIQVACENGATASGVLTHVWEIVQKRLAQAFGIKLCALFCPECGASLKQCPEIGKTVKCNSCGEIIKAESLTG